MSLCPLCVLDVIHPYVCDVCDVNVNVNVGTQMLTLAALTALTALATMLAMMLTMMLVTVAMAIEMAMVMDKTRQNPSGPRSRLRAMSGKCTSALATQAPSGS